MTTKGLNRWIVWGLFCIVASTASADTLPAWPSLNQQSGHFVQKKHLLVLSKPFVSKGRYDYQADLGLRWKTDFPVASELLINASGISEVQTDCSQQALTTDNQVSALLLALFSGDQNSLQQQFSVESLPSSVRLVPKNPQFKAIFSNIDVVLAAGAITDIELHETSGNVTHISLSPDLSGSESH